MKTFSIISCYFLTLSLFNCVSTRDHQTLLQDKQRLTETVARLRKENEEITIEKFNAEGAARGRGADIQNVEVRFSSQVTGLEAQIEKLKADNARLTEDNNRHIYENQRIKKESFNAQQERSKELEELREKLNWVYRTYNIQRAKKS